MDLSLIIAYLVLVALGISNIYSSVYNPDKPFLVDLTTEHGKQIVWVVIALLLSSVIMFIDSDLIKRLSFWVYGITLLLLIAVLFTNPINGAKSWFGIGSFGIQPSELAKLGTCMALSAQFSTKLKRLSSTSNISLIRQLLVNWKIIAILGLPALLVLLQPDAGTFIVFTSFILVLYREGYAGNILLFSVIAVVIAFMTLIVEDTRFMVPYLKIKMTGKAGILTLLFALAALLFFSIRRFVLKRNRKPLYRALIAMLAVTVLFVYFVEWGYTTFLDNHQKERIDLVLGKIEDPDGKGYNINRAKAAIGSGGFTGKGYQKATLANSSQKHVPMQSTDFIFCTWSEERGFLGAFLLVALYSFLLVKIVSVAERQRSHYNRIYAYCVASLFFYHVVINIGMGIGLVPVIGIPLPLFSYGGSQVLTFSLLLSVLIKLDAERKIGL